MNSWLKFMSSILIITGFIGISYAQVEDSRLARDTTAASAPAVIKLGVIDVLKVYKAWDVQKQADAEFQPLRDKLQGKDKEISRPCPG